MNYAKAKLNDSLINHFSSHKLQSNYKEEIKGEMFASNFFEKNMYTVIRHLESKDTYITGISDYSEFKGMCMAKTLPDIPYDMLYVLSQDNMLGIIERELKLDVDEVKSALLIKHYGDDSKSIIGIDVDKVDHITKIYDLDNDGIITENEHKLNDLKINYELGSLERSEPYKRQVEYNELGL
ncbi:hypothetical protein R2F61_01830 [Mollicutes bacterium LVI A0078]|nr:hypothetical protein RZE84_01825 [Mollicutes bacterium LVI A0075]WOO90530.1 hypothetical protein R2F61_07305 [Mollicutes bacterium LVI A0078]WOO91315.1 hypothetical protein R2F61_01830 [Mollicutes bacterium LVI A0078]